MRETAYGAYEQILQLVDESEGPRPPDTILNILDRLGYAELETLAALLHSYTSAHVSSNGILCHVVFIDIPARMRHHDVLQHALGDSSPMMEIDRVAAKECMARQTEQTEADIEANLPIGPSKHKPAFNDWPANVGGKKSVSHQAAPSASDDGWCANTYSEIEPGNWSQQLYSASYSLLSQNRRKFMDQAANTWAAAGMDANAIRSRLAPLTLSKWQIIRAVAALLLFLLALWMAQNLELAR